MPQGNFSLTRRTMLASAVSMLGQAQKPNKLKIVVTGGHPGDPEYGCGGTVARYADLGHDVTLLYLNHGEKGCGGKQPSDCAILRTAEARAACDLLNAKAVFARQSDGETVVNAAGYDEFRQLIENEKPNILFTHWPIDGHRDHRAMSSLAYDAWLKMRCSFGFYYYEVSDGADTLMFKPTDYVDISATEARKREACYAHRSQAPDRFYALQSQVTHFRGVEFGVTQAEAFVRHERSPRALMP
jgi:N-acetylglucosamine malate deacetylase 1